MNNIINCIKGNFICVRGNISAIISINVFSRPLIGIYGINVKTTIIDGRKQEKIKC